MSLTNLQRQWETAAHNFGLKVTAPFVAHLMNGDRVEAEVLLEGYGAPRGMLIVSDFKAIESMTDQIVRSGFGYSCMPQPTDEEVEVPLVDAMADVLKDWGICANDDEA